MYQRYKHPKHTGILYIKYFLKFVFPSASEAFEGYDSLHNNMGMTISA